MIVPGDIPDGGTAQLTQTPTGADAADATGPPPADELPRRLSASVTARTSSFSLFGSSAAPIAPTADVELAPLPAGAASVNAGASATLSVESGLPLPAEEAPAVTAAPSALLVPEAVAETDLGGGVTELPVTRVYQLYYE